MKIEFANISLTKTNKFVNTYLRFLSTIIQDDTLASGKNDYKKKIQNLF